jgi:hypothetical protein
MKDMEDKKRKQHMARKSIKFDTNIPIPKDWNLPDSKKGSTYHFSKFEKPGDSLFFRDKTRANGKVALYNWYARVKGSEYEKWQFAFEEVTVDGVKGLRVWRAEDIEEDEERTGPSSSRKHTRDTLRENLGKK